MSNPTPRWSALIALSIVALAACNPAGGSPSNTASLAASASPSAAASVTVSAACSDAMSAAAAIEDVSDATADLIRGCDSVAEFVAAAAANPEALRGASPQLFAENACASLEVLKDEPICVELGN